MANQSTVEIPRTEEEERLITMTVAELKEELKQRRFKVSGRKEDLMITM